ncbi:MAG: PilZ domain-containing protein [Terracidiphilus sp.]
MEVLQSSNERRERQRFGVNAPVTILAGSREIPGFTRDLSNLGVYFYLNLADGATIGGDFEFLLELPPEITLSTSCMVRCRGQVVRTDDSSAQMTGIAARILEYSIEKEEALSA